MDDKIIDVKKAIQILNDGGIIIYPTDTAFGMGCRIDRKDAVDRFFEIRKRDRLKATPILVSSQTMAQQYYVSVTAPMQSLMDTYWPGALTIIGPAKVDRMYEPIRGGGETIGIRMPNHEAILQIIAGIGVPIIGSSANFAGGKTPYKEEDLDAELVTLSDGVVSGSCSVGIASTVVDCTTDPYTIVRQGAVSL